MEQPKRNTKRAKKILEQMAREDTAEFSLGQKPVPQRKRRVKPPPAAKQPKARVGVKAPKPAKPKIPPRAATPQAPRAQATPLEQLRRRKRLRKVRNLVLMAALVVGLIAWLTGLGSASWALLQDVGESISIGMNASGSFPATTGIAAPLQVEELAGGFLELGEKDLLVYSASGARLRSIQHGYARPAVAVGGNRFCLYNRSGYALSIESRTKTLYTKTFDNAILVCAMSGNGSLAVVTRGTRYAAELSIYSPRMIFRLGWSISDEEGMPIAAAFASDNHRLAVGTLQARQGTLCSTVYLLDTGKDDVGTSFALPGSTLLQLYWLSSDRLLAVTDNEAVLLNTTDMSEVARYNYAAVALQSIDYEKQLALLLSDGNGSRLVLLDKNLDVVMEQHTSAAQRVVLTRTKAYLLRRNEVECLDFTGETQWTQQFEQRVYRVLNARQLLLFSGNTVQQLKAP